MARLEVRRSRYTQFPIETDRDGRSRTLWVKIDTEDEKLISGRSWHISWDGRTAYPHTGNGGTSTTMGRLLLGEGNLAGLGRVQHLNGNGMDCRRHNLRLTTQDRLLAARSPTGGVSRFKGVTWDREQRKWLAVFRGKKIGRFVDEEEAALAFDAVAREHWGGDAYLNFPPRPKGVPMTGPRARLLRFAIAQCLDTEEFQGDGEATDVLLKAAAVAQRWVSHPPLWLTPAVADAVVWTEPAWDSYVI